MFNKKKLFFLICSAFIFSVVIILTQHFLFADAQTPSSYPIAGWWWSENYGWFSLNSSNCIKDGVQQCISPANVSYGLKITGNEIYGYAWSEHVGWMCVGNGGSDSSKACTNLPLSLGGSLLTSVVTSTGRITGWGKILALGDDGWVKFDSTEIVTTTSRPICYGCTTECAGDPEVCQKNCLLCFSQKNHPLGSEPYGMGAVCFANKYYNCNEVDDGGSTITDCSSASAVGEVCRLYGAAGDIVNGSFNDGKLIGWVWGGKADAPTSPSGVGWISLNAGPGSQVIYPWLQTRYGAIYTSSTFEQKSISKPNSTFCIFADKIVNVSSYTCNQNIIRDLVLTYPQASSTNSIKYIDVEGLITKTNGEYNKYGNKVQVLSNLDSLPSVLNDSIYVINSDAVISAKTINNGSVVAGVTNRGNGLVVVKGNLTINGDIKYENVSPPSDLKQLASLGWIVQGDVKVDSAVKNIIGAFILLGNGTTCQKNNLSDPEFPKYILNGCGVFYSGEGSNLLSVYGLVMAKAFDFRRNYADAIRGAEQIVYDGRWLANPPTGLKSLVEKLPLVTDFIYGQ